MPVSTDYVVKYCVVGDKSCSVCDKCEECKKEIISLIKIDEMFKSVLLISRR